MGDGARLEISASLAGQHGVAVVQALRGREEVSRPFAYEVDLAADELLVEELRGTTAELLLEDAQGRTRHLSGVVARIDVLAGEAAPARHRLHLVPLPGLLAFRHGFRIFQDLTVPQIVERVLRDAGLDASAWRLSISGTYPSRPLCVQYDESEWDFVSRLLEEEGIWFSFDHTEGGHTMVIADASSNAPRADPDSLPADPGGGLGLDVLRAWALTEQAQVCVGKVLLDDYDFLHPSVDLHAEEAGADGHGTWYEYPGRYQAPVDGKRLARARLAELRAGRSAIRFETNALSLQAGQRVEITDHPDVSGSWFVTAVTLRCRVEDITAGLLSEEGPAGSWLEVEAVPSNLPFRPARRSPRPRVEGPQTARVTGPAGEEIHCDQHGRVKLQFHWDREGKLDERSSAWIRVVQPQTTGSMMIPRVGWEVLVDFLEGDPDQPLCLGRLYNPLFGPPLSLPAEKTVTAHRSESSPGGGGVNEVRFDDAAGSQQVLVGAHRDLVVTASEKRTKRVGKQEQRTVGANRTDAVHADESVSVTGSHSGKVGAAQHIAVGARTVAVVGDLAEEVAGDVTLEVGAAETVKVGNPVKALLQLAATEAIQAATAAAQGYVDSAAKALVAPLKPALDAVSKAAAGLKAGGRAAAFLGGDPAKAIGPLPPGVQAAAENAGPELEQAVSHAITGAAAAAAPDAARKVADAIGPSDGNLALTVGGDLTEKIGAVEILTGIGGIAIGVGGDSLERVGAVRLELAGGGRSESTGGSKKETVAGAYLVDVKEGMSLSAGGAASLLVAGKATQKIGKGHTLTAKTLATLTASKLELKAGSSITFKCGQAELTLNGEGVSLKGTLVTIKGKTIKLTPPAIGPG